MKWKALARKVAPPLVVDLYNHYRQGTRPGHIWEGVYEHYRNVPAHGAPFDSVSWAAASRMAVEHAVMADSSGAARTSVPGDHLSLPMLASIVGDATGTLTVLDYGGGAGEAYAHLNCSTALKTVRYHVVEREAVCEVGRRFWNDDPRIQFHTALPPNLIDVDIIYLSSTMQYVEDYRALLTSLCEYRPRYMLFTKLSAGNIPTYASAQRNLRGSTIPYWFINVGEFVDLMRARGYRLLFKAALEPEYNQENFSLQYRLGRACSLLFGRSPE